MSALAPTRREAVVAALLFGLTFASSVSSYALFFGGGELVLGASALRDGLSFAAALMGILLAHEMGHYVVARAHGFAVSLPWFVPFPNLFGTLGAIIRLKSLPSSRQALLEMGAAGPLAGGLVAVALLWVSVRWSQPAVDLPRGTSVLVFQDPLLVQLVGILTTGARPDPMAVYHPVTLAAWAGCFLTGLNLLPIGQLDGGHVLNAVWPRRARLVSTVGPFALVAAGLWWPGWILLGLLLLFLSAGRPLPIPDEAPLPIRSRIIAGLVLLLFVLTFLPAPMVEATIGAAP